MQLRKQQWANRKPNAEAVCGRHIRREGHCHRTSRRAEDLHDQQTECADGAAKVAHSGEVGSEIRNAVNAGKEVTVHEKSINKHGWKGFGYIVIDPETGAGAYLIEGSGNEGKQIDAAIAKALNINQLAPDRIKQSIMNYNLGMLNRVSRMVEHAPSRLVLG